MRKISYSNKIRLISFVLGPVTTTIGILLMIGDTGVFKTLENIVGIVGLLIMLVLKVCKFEAEDDRAKRNFDNACTTLLEILFALGCLISLISLNTEFKLVLSPHMFAMITGISLIVLGLLFELFEHRSDFG